MKQDMDTFLRRLEMTALLFTNRVRPPLPPASRLRLPVGRMSTTATQVTRLKTPGIPPSLSPRVTRPRTPGVPPLSRTRSHTDLSRGEWPCRMAPLRGPGPHKTKSNGTAGGSSCWGWGQLLVTKTSKRPPGKTIVSETVKLKGFVRTHEGTPRAHSLQAGFWPLPSPLLGTMPRKTTNAG